MSCGILIYEAERTHCGAVSLSVVDMVENSYMAPSCVYVFAHVCSIGMQVLHSLIPIFIRIFGMSHKNNDGWQRQDTCKF